MANPMNVTDIMQRNGVILARFTTADAPRVRGEARNGRFRHMTRNLTVGGGARRARSEVIRDHRPHVDDDACALDPGRCACQ